MISHDREFLNPLVGSIVEIAHRSCSATAATGTATSNKKRRAKSSNSRPTRTSRRRSPRCRNSPTGSAQGEQSLAGAEQAEADRSHGENRGAASQDEDDPFPVSAAAASGSRAITLKEWRPLLRPTWSVYAGWNSRRSADSAPCSSGRTARANRRCSNCSPAFLPVQSGRARARAQREVGYFSQYRVEMLTRQTVLESVHGHAAIPSAEQTARTVLGSLPFSRR